MHENEDSFCLFFSVRFFMVRCFSQTTNFALRFNGDGKVDCGTISDLNNLDLYSSSVFGESVRMGGKCLCF